MTLTARPAPVPLPVKENSAAPMAAAKAAELAMPEAFVRKMVNAKSVLQIAQVKYAEMMAVAAAAANASVVIALRMTNSTVNVFGVASQDFNASVLSRLNAMASPGLLHHFQGLVSHCPVRMKSLANQGY